MAGAEGIEEPAQRQDSSAKLLDRTQRRAQIEEYGDDVVVVDRVGHNRVLAFVFLGYLSLKLDESRHLGHLWLEDGGSAGDGLQHSFRFFHGSFACSSRCGIDGMLIPNGVGNNHRQASESAEITTVAAALDRPEDVRIHCVAHHVSEAAVEELALTR